MEHIGHLQARAFVFNEKARCVSFVLACFGVGLGPLGGLACAAEAWLGGLSGTFGDARKRWRTPLVSAIWGAGLSAPETQHEPPGIADPSGDLLDIPEEAKNETNTLAISLKHLWGGSCTQKGWRTPLESAIWDARVLASDGSETTPSNRRS